MYLSMISSRYLFNLGVLRLYSLMMISNDFLQSIVMYLVCSLFAEKAAYNIESMAWVSRFLNLVLFVIIVVYSGISIA
jgi:hypothetical protein